MEINHSDDMRAFGDRLERERCRLGFNEAGLGERCGHTALNVKAWESGRSYPSVPVLCALANTGVDVFFLFTGHDGPRSLRAATMLEYFQDCDETTQKQIADLARTGSEKHKKDTQEFLTRGAPE